MNNPKNLDELLGVKIADFISNPDYKMTDDKLFSLLESKYIQRRIEMKVTNNIGYSRLREGISKEDTQEALSVHLAMLDTIAKLNSFFYD